MFLYKLEKGRKAQKGVEVSNNFRDFIRQFSHEPSWDFMTWLMGRAKDVVPTCVLRALVTTPTVVGKLEVLARRKDAKPKFAEHTRVSQWKYFHNLNMLIVW